MISLAGNLDRETPLSDNMPDNTYRFFFNFQHAALLYMNLQKGLQVFAYSTFCRPESKTGFAHSFRKRYAVKIHHVFHVFPFGNT